MQAMVRHPWLAVAVCGMLGGAAAQLAKEALWNGPSAARAQQPPASPTSLWITAPDAPQWTAEEEVNIAVYEKANRGVVNITTQAVQIDDFWRTAVPSEGAGSGSVIDRQGHILTNYHVVEGVQRIQVTLANGQSYQAGIVGTDPQNDIAVLQIDAPPEALVPVEMADTVELRVGQKVYAIGNPFGLERTLTAGIISSLNRSLPSKGQVARTIRSIIQIDAALNRGSSGGPLLNTRGKLIGMNTAIASSTGENTGVGFAIPVSTIARVVPQLIHTGRVTRADLGITYAFAGEKGLIVAIVRPGGPADKADLRGFRIVTERRQRGPFIYERRTLDREAADTIVAVDEQPVKAFDDLLAYVEQKAPGDQIVLTILRNGTRQEIPVRLGLEQ